MSEFAWASEIVREHFSRGIQHLVESQVMDPEYYRKKVHEDPIYSVLLKGMGDEALARTFVGYWTAGQTLATQSRFWLNAAIADILVERYRRQSRTDVRVFAGWMMGRGFFERGISLMDLGESEREEVLGVLAWRVPMSRRCLDSIALLLDRHERAHTASPDAGDKWLIVEQSEQRDKEELARAVASLADVQGSLVNLNCDLLVVEPDRADGAPHVWAFRFVNPRVLRDHGTRKQERLNLLRLYAYLVQEKVLRDPTQMRVAVADIVDRRGGHGGSRYPEYFSSLTHWDAPTLWEFIGVPFSAIQNGVRQAGSTLSKELRKGLDDLLPHADDWIREEQRDS